jgi:hypothetical protein
VAGVRVRCGVMVGASVGDEIGRLDSADEVGGASEDDTIG